jgi:hypothetical protein
LSQAKEYNQTCLWLGAKGKKEADMKRLLLVFGLVFFAGCGPDFATVENQLAQQAESNLRKMFDKHSAELANFNRDVDNLHADQNALDTKISAFLGTLTDEQLSTLIRYNTSENLLQLEKTKRVLFQVMSSEQISRIHEQYVEQDRIETKRNELVARAESLDRDTKALQEIRRIVDAQFYGPRPQVIYEPPPPFILPLASPTVIIDPSPQPQQQWPPPNYWQEKLARQQWWDNQYRKIGVTPH